MELQSPQVCRGARPLCFLDAAEGLGRTSSAREIRTPEDLKGFRMRVPAAPMLTSLFQALGAGPTPINFNELYSALQTKVVDGQENPLPVVATAKLNEVQKFCSLTSHVWDSYLILGNRRSFQRLPADARDIVARELNKSAEDERKDIAALSSSPQGELAAKGMKFVNVDKAAFRDTLKKTSFYKDWRTKLGEVGWRHPEDAVGELG